MAANIHSRLSTSTPSINMLINDIKKGEIKVPQFQRPFVWKDEQAIELLDSISSNYPVGSLLLWKTPTKLATERATSVTSSCLRRMISRLRIIYSTVNSRSTVIYSCIGAGEKDPGFAAAYDLDNENFIRKPDQHAIHIFPMRWLYDTTKLLNFLVQHFNLIQTGKNLMSGSTPCIKQ